MVQPVCIAVCRANRGWGLQEPAAVDRLERIHSGMYNLLVTNKFSLEKIINLYVPL